MPESYIDTIRFIVIAIIPYGFAISFHEAAHAYAAAYLGDNTAKSLGRLTLNPLKHLDPIGMLVLLITRMIGWAKPVPIDYRIVSRHKYGLAIVAVAGPLANLILAIISGLLFSIALVISNKLQINMRDTLFMGLTLEPLVNMLSISILINITFCVFNLLPFPPLDGSKVISIFLPKEVAYKMFQFERYGFIILIALMYLGVLRPIIRGATAFLYGGILDMTKIIYNLFT